jgi:hypothetical protein
MKSTTLATLLTVAFGCLSSGCHVGKHNPENFPIFTELSREDAGHLDMPLQINALTMISKRVERGEPVSFLQLLRITGEQLARFEREWHK